MCRNLLPQKITAGTVLINACFLLPKTQACQLEEERGEEEKEEEDDDKDLEIREMENRKKGRNRWEGQ